MVQTARYETFDFHPPMDNMKLTPHPKRAGSGPWYGNVEGVEQTCFLLMSEEAIADLAEEFGKKELAEKYRGIIARRIKAVQEKMWDPKTQFFYSLDRDSYAKIPVRTIQGFFRLPVGRPLASRLRPWSSSCRTRKQWWAGYPVPTVAMDDPKFGANAMWRGDMWPATTYLVACGLNRYGYHDVAQQLADRMRRLIAEHGINERYNALTGKAHRRSRSGHDLLGVAAAGAELIRRAGRLPYDFRAPRRERPTASLGQARSLLPGRRTSSNSVRPLIADSG